MSDSAPNSEDLVEELQSSDRFSKLVEKIAEYFHDDEYRDERLPDIKSEVREEP